MSVKKVIETVFMRTRGAGHAPLTCPFLQLVQDSQALCSALRQVDLDFSSVSESLCSTYSRPNSFKVAEGASDLVQRSGGVLAGKMKIEPG